MKRQLPLAVITLATLTCSGASGIPISLTLELDAIVTFISFTPAMDYLTSDHMSTASVGESFTVIISLNTDHGFLTEPDFGTDMGTNDGSRKPVEGFYAFDAFGLLLGSDRFVWAGLQKTGPMLTAETLSGPNVFDLSFALDTITWTGTLGIVGQYELDEENNYGSLRGSITGARVREPVPDLVSSLSLLTLGLAVIAFTGRRRSSQLRRRGGD